MNRSRSASSGPPGPEAADEQLDLVNGDLPGAFGRLFDLHAEGLYRYLASRAGGQVADDLVSETFLAALKSRERYEPSRGTAQAWLFRDRDQPIA